MFQRILFIADNHALMDSLLRYVPKIFPDAEYHVMGVVDYSPFFLTATDYIHETVESAVVGAVMSSKEILAAQGKDCLAGIVWGDFHARVEKYTEEADIDLVAVETFMDEETKKSHLTWHVDRLFRGTDRPILIIDRLVEMTPPERILALLTEHPLSLRASETAVDLAAFLGAGCTVLSVVEKVTGDARGQLLERSSDAGVELTFLEQPDAEVDEILETVRNHSFLVMTRGGRGIVDRVKMSVTGLPIGRKAYEVFAAAPVPTLLVGGREVDDDG